MYPNLSFKETDSSNLVPTTSNGVVAVVGFFPCGVLYKPTFVYSEADLAFHFGVNTNKVNSVGVLEYAETYLTELRDDYEYCVQLLRKGVPLLITAVADTSDIFELPTTQSRVVGLSVDFPLVEVYKNTLVVTGDATTGTITAGDKIVVNTPTGVYAGIYNVVSRTFASGETTIVVVEDIVSSLTNVLVSPTVNHKVYLNTGTAPSVTTVTASRISLQFKGDFYMGAEINEFGLPTNRCMISFKSSENPAHNFTTFTTEDYITAQEFSRLTKGLFTATTANVLGVPTDKLGGFNIRLLGDPDDLRKVTSSTAYIGTSDPLSNDVSIKVLEDYLDYFKDFTILNCTSKDVIDFVVGWAESMKKNALLKAPTALTPIGLLDYIRGTGAYDGLSDKIVSKRVRFYGLTYVNTYGKELSSLIIGIAERSKKARTLAYWIPEATIKTKHTDVISMMYNMANRAKYPTLSDALVDEGVNLMAYSKHSGYTFVGTRTAEVTTSLYRYSHVVDLVDYVRDLCVPILERYIPSYPNAPTTWKQIYLELSPILESIVTKGGAQKIEYIGDQDAKDLDNLVYNDKNEVLAGKYKLKLKIYPYSLIEGIDVELEITN